MRISIALTSILSSGCQTIATASAAARAALDGFLDFYFRGYRTGLPDTNERAAFASKASLMFDAALEQSTRAGHHAEYKVGFEYRTPGAAALCATP